MAVCVVLSCMLLFALRFYCLRLNYLLKICLSSDKGVKAIENLMQKKGKFDYILLETTGLADPGNYTT